MSTILSTTNGPLKLPPNKPKISQAELHEKLAKLGHVIDRQKYPIVLVGIRGYYEDSFGVKGANDRGVYDDALIIDCGDEYHTFNGNTDPSKFRNGKGKGAEKGMACLQPGVWYAHRMGLHKGSYLALVQQAGQVTVMRDGTPPYPDTGYFGINIHKGGNSTTSSEGCQTIPPTQYNAFIEKVKQLATKHSGNAGYKNITIPYVLIDN